MARDRNLSVWQAYVIVMSFVSLLCIGALCYTVFQSGTNFKTVEAAQKQQNEANEKVRKELDKSQLLEMVLGEDLGMDQAEVDKKMQTFTGDAKMDSIQKKYVKYGWLVITLAILTFTLFVNK
jgi:hypothetical protein